MGLLGELGKALMGRPIGPASWNDKSTAPAQGSQVPQGDGIRDERGLKIIPEIEVKNVRSNRNGEHLRVTALIENKSDQPIRIDTTLLIGQSKTQNRFLNPRSSYEHVLYEGKIPDNDNETKARITYRLQVNNDVFLERYRVDYSLESDGKHIVTDLIDEGPVQDI